MPSTYSPNLRIELIGTGEQSGTWGLTTNSNLGTIIESAISGYVVVTTTTANQALTALNGAADEARNMILELDTTTGAPYNVYIPNAEKFYVIRNASEYPVTIYCSTALGNTTAAGDGVTIPGATVSGTIPTTFQICTDGTDVYDALNSFAGPLTVSGDVTLGNRFSATYSKPSSGSSTVTVTTTVAHGYSTGNIIQFIPTTGSPEFVPGGDYTITVTGPTTFTFTASTTQASIFGSAFVTDDTITLNGVVQPGVVIASDTGTTYPALRITQVGTGAALLVEDNTNPDASPFLITGGGQVIKGYTEAISSKNSTGGGTLTFDTQVIGTSEATSGIGVFNYSATTGADPSISFNKSLNATVGDHTAVTDGTQLGVIGFAGSDAGAGNAQAFQSAAYIMGAADDNATAGSVPGRLIFATTLAGDPYPTERMRINNQGRVGINATSLTTFGFRNNQPFNSDASVNGAAVRQMYLEGAITATVAGSSYSSSGLEVQTTWNQAGLAMSFNLSSGGWARGIYSSPTITGSSGTVTASSAFVAEVTNTGAGTLTSAVGFNAAGVANTGGGTLTNAFAFYVPADWTGATNNYGYYSDIPTATDRWNFYANGTAPNYFGGNTIINVTDNTNAALKITQAGTGNAILVQDVANVDNTPFVIDKDGKTIRGFTAAQPIRISTTAVTPALQNLGVNTTDSSAILGVANTTNSTASYLFFAKWASGTIGNNSTVVANDEALGYISWSGSDGSNQTQAASISAFVDGTPGASDMPGRLVFSTTPDGSPTPTERMRIRSDGVVVIGADAGATLNLKAGATGTTGSINWTFSTDSTVYGSMSLPYDTRTTVGLKLESSATYPITLNSGNGVIFQEDGSENMRLDTSGRLLINQTTNYTIGDSNGWILQAAGAGASVIRTGADVNPAYLTLAKTRSTSLGTYTAVNTNDVLGQISFVGDDGADYANTAAYIRAEVDGSVASNDVPGRLIFSTKLDGGSITERLRISNDGRIQINGSNTLASSLVSTSNAFTFPATATGTRYHYRADAVFNTPATTSGIIGFGSTYSLPSTGAVTSSYQFYAGTLDTAGVVPTNSYGFYCAGQGTVAATNVYGFFSDIASATNRWNFYADGTADNYFKGKVGIGVTAPTAILHLSSGGSAANSAPLKFTTSNGTLLGTAENGTIEYDGTVMLATTNSNFKRGTIPVTNYSSGAATSLAATNESVLVSLLPSANNSITLSTGTYFLDISFTITRGTTSATPAYAVLDIQGSGGAVGSFSGMVNSSVSNGGATSNFSFSSVSIATAQQVTASSNTAAGVYTITLRGLLKVTTSGSITPQYALNTDINAGTATTGEVLYFRLQQLDTQSASNFGPAGTGWS